MMSYAVLLSRQDCSSTKSRRSSLHWKQHSSTRTQEPPAVTPMPVDRRCRQVSLAWRKTSPARQRISAPAHMMPRLTPRIPLADTSVAPHRRCPHTTPTASSATSSDLGAAAPQLSADRPAAVASNLLLAIDPALAAGKALQPKLLTDSWSYPASALARAAALLDDRFLRCHEKRSP